MSFTRLQVGDRFGRIVDELQGKIDHVSWRINKVGQVKFRIPVNDPKATETNLNPGNRIFMDFENGLPDWGGVIDLPRTWERGILQVAAYSGEHLFKYRTTDKGRYFDDQTPGQIFESLILEMNQVETTGITIGTIFKGGSGHSPDYHFKSLLDIFQKSLTDRLSTYEFDVVPYIDGGIIKFNANFYDTRGGDRTNHALVEGNNLAPIKIKEQGPIINSWDMAGEGTDWGSGRLTSNAADIDSQSDFGLREDSRIYGDVSQQLTLDSHSETALVNTKDPKNLFLLQAVDEQPARFADYEHGDKISLEIHSMGFGGIQTVVRITSREFLPQVGLCNLVVEEVV